MGEGTLSPHDLAGCLEATLDRQLRLIGAADSRIGLVLALDTAMLGGLAALAPGVGVWSCGLLVASLAATALLLGSLLFLTLASFPRTTGPQGSLLFFQGIASKSSDAYVRDMLAISTLVYTTDLAQQCHRNAEIAKAKFSWLQRSLVAMYLGLLPWLWSVYALYQHRQ